MDVESPYKEGFLLFPTIIGILKKKTWQKKYCKLFRSSKLGLERLEIFDTEGETWKNTVVKILTLDNCIKIAPNASQKNQPLMFSIVTKAINQDVVALTETDLQDWVSSFQTVAFDKGEENVRLSSTMFSSEEFEESNDLYCSANEGVFTVQIIPTSVSNRCGLRDLNYTLVVTQSALQLRSAPPNEKLLFTWPFMYIRRYGYKNGILSFDAGRKCDSGEGPFQLKTDQQKGIFQCISSTMKNWRQFIKNDETQQVSSPAQIACGDSQFQAALSMEPGSRTPLPPSPTTSTNPPLSMMSELSNVLESSHSLKARKPMHPTPITTSNSSLGLMSDLCTYDNSTSNKPRKPPRKVPLTLPHSRGMEYDEVEKISQAWKTMGVGDFSHVEHITNDTVELNIKKPSTFKEEAPSTQRKFITQPSIESLEDYDTLQHFGAQSASLRYSEESSLYSQVNDSAFQTKIQEVADPPSWNEYDFIGTDLQQTFRPADDSHLGYGTIRKVSPQPAEYAEVTKPKQV